MATTATLLSLATRELVRSSFPMVERIAPRAGTMFYGRLFATAPEVIPQFRRDLSQPDFQPAAEHRSTSSWRRWWHRSVRHGTEREGASGRGRSRSR